MSGWIFNDIVEIMGSRSDHWYGIASFVERVMKKAASQIRLNTWCYPEEYIFDMVGLFGGCGFCSH